MKIGRNDPCHCGSNKKFKHCHQKTNIKQNNQLILLGIVGAIVIIFLITFSDGENEQKINSSNTLSNSLTPVKAAKPSSPAPPGKVWHEEHGHYHDIPIQNNSSSLRLNNNIASSPISKARPSAPAPPGKIWHEEHGHYHDAPKSQSLSPKIVNTQNKNNPNVKTDIVPEGKVWDDKHGHYHDKDK